MVAEKSQERVAVEIAYGRRTSTSVNLTALIRYETTVHRTLAGDGEHGSAKFRSPRRDAHKKEPRDTLNSRVRESEREATTGLAGSWLHGEYLFRYGWKRRAMWRKTPRKLQSQRVRDPSFLPPSFEKWRYRKLSPQPDKSARVENFLAVNYLQLADMANKLHFCGLLYIILILSFNKKK